MNSAHRSPASPAAHQDQRPVRQDRRQDLQRWPEDETVTVDRRDIHLGQVGTDYVFMNQSTYEQINASAETAGDANSDGGSQNVIVPALASSQRAARHRRP